jgi:hypothetical protein
MTDGVEQTRTIASKNHDPGMKILHRETKWVKLDRTIIVNGQLADGKRVLMM